MAVAVLARAAASRRVPHLAVALLLATSANSAAAQTIDDGLMVKPRQLRLTVEYGRDVWNEYWEGALQRSNDNLGTVTTQSASATAAYGVTDRLSVVATLPYVWTAASQGVLHGLRGRQDLTVAAKFRLLQLPVGERLQMRATVLGGVGTPTSDYTPDFLPLSIGLGSQRVLARAAVHVQDRAGWFVDGSAGHAWRSNVRLDRPAYYTNGHLTLSDEVAMPDVSEYMVSAGLQRGRLCLPISLSGQRTLGGGDIRRQDMPFVSNRMNFTRMHARVMYTLPGLSAVTVNLGGMRTLSGRNVGRSSMIAGGLTYAFGL